MTFRPLPVLALALWPALGAAQDWATAEVCRVDPGPVEASAYDPPGLAALEAAASGIPNGTGRFWQVSAPGGAISHLWGTWHSSDPLILDLTDTVVETIEASRLVAVETDFVAKDRDDWRAAQYLEGRYREPGDPFDFSGADIDSIAGLDDEVSGWIRDRAIELGWTEDVTLILSPAGIAEMLLSDPCEDFASGVLPLQDDYVQLLGRLAGVPILGLEAPSEFIDDLNAGDPATADAIIAVYAAYLRPVTDNTTRSALFQLYREGRLDLLAAWDAAFLEDVLGDRAANALQATDAYLLGYRNKRFLDRLAPEWEKGGVFVAVGAGHLPGEEGLVAMLRERGFTVTRVPLPGEAP